MADDFLCHLCWAGRLRSNGKLWMEQAADVAAATALEATAPMPIRSISNMYAWQLKRLKGHAQSLQKLLNVHPVPPLHSQ